LNLSLAKKACDQAALLVLAVKTRGDETTTTRPADMDMQSDRRIVVGRIDELSVADQA
jgi:hypothetical protein